MSEPKMYRLLPEYAHEYSVYFPNIPYDENHQVDGALKVKTCAKLNPNHWQLITDQPQVLKMLNKYTQVSVEFLNHLIENHLKGTTFAHHQKKYWTFNGSQYVGCDNTTNDCFIECFITPEELIKWLQGAHDQPQEESQPFTPPSIHGSETFGIPIEHQGEYTSIEVFTPTHTVTDGAHKGKRVSIIAEDGIECSVLFENGEKAMLLLGNIELIKEQFIPTHEVTGGDYKNQKVIILHDSIAGTVAVKTKQGEIFDILEGILKPITPPTTLTEAAYNDLIQSIREHCQVSTPFAENAVKEWTTRNDIKTPNN